MSDTETPGIVNPDVAAPGPHPHQSDDFYDWGGITRDERRSQSLSDSPAGDPDAAANGLAAPGPHPHTSADFSLWAGEAGHGRPTVADTVTTLQGPVKVLGTETEEATV